MKLSSFRIKNLRSLSQEQEFTFPPLTLVVGTNSSGKSSYLRSFPLLRQSAETVTKGPILWFGRFVDYGVFKDAVSRSDPQGQIEFGFSVKIGSNAVSDLFNYNISPNLHILNEIDVDVTLGVAQEKGTENTFTQEIRICALDQNIIIKATPDGQVTSFLLNDENIVSSIMELSLRSGTSLLSLSCSRRSSEGSVKNVSLEWRQPGAFPDLVLRQLNYLFHGRTAEDVKVGIAKWLGIGTTDNFVSLLKKLCNRTATSRARSNSLKNNSNWVKKLQALVLADRVPFLLNEIDNFLTDVFRQVSYIGPLRATAERFYRQQDLAVDEVDPQGANLAMFLMGLKKSEQYDFSKWCSDNIGFSVEARVTGSHVSMNLRDSKEGADFNIADMGFGYSQLLPVLATIWSAQSQREDRSSERVVRRRTIYTAFRFQDELPKIISIEQPELHLHPRLQGKLANLLAFIANKTDDKCPPIHLICETHSETIINQIGILINNKKIDSTKIQILIFDKADENGLACTKVTKSTFDDDGILKNWPYGFFLAEDTE